MQEAGNNLSATLCPISGWVGGWVGGCQGAGMEAKHCPSQPDQAGGGPSQEAKTSKAFLCAW